MYKVFNTYEDVSKEASQRIFEDMEGKLSQSLPYVLGCATGSTPVGCYHHLLAHLSHSRQDLSNFYTVNLDEYFPMSKSNTSSYYYWMYATLWHPLQKLQSGFLFPSHVCMPDGEAMDPGSEAQLYEKKLSDIGGIDMQILGIGENGHIGFNEPGSDEHSLTRLVDLSLSTRKANARFFDQHLSNVPKQALTMGIGTILRSRRILVLASGKKKAPILKKIFTEKIVSPTIPASFLLHHPHVEWLVDADASSLMK